MADISMGNLRFDLTADNSAFNDAIKRAEETHRAAAQDMGRQMEDAAKKAEEAQRSMWDKIGTKTYETIRKIQDFGKAFGEAFQGGADAAEKWTTDTFNALKDKSEQWVRKWVETIPLGIGKFVAGTFDLLKNSGAIDTFMDWGGKQIAGWLDKWAEKFQASGFTDKFKAGLVATASTTNTLLGGLFDQGSLDESQKRVETWADSVKQKMDEMVEGVRTALQKLAGTWDGISDKVKEAIEALKKANDNRAFQGGLLGLDEGARARAQAERAFDEQSGKKLSEYNEKELAARKAELDRTEDIATRNANMQKLLQTTQQYEQSVQSVTAALKRQGDLALANAGMGYGKSAYDRAIERGSAIAEGYGRGRNQGISNDPAVQDALRSSADAQQQAANIKFNYDLAEALKQQSAAYDLQTRSLGASAGEAERMKFVQQELNKAYREGVPITDGLRSMIDSSASALGRAAQAAAEAKEQFNQLKQMGQAVANSLEGAFSNWISGTQQSWKSFMSGLLADMAKLQFKNTLSGLLGTSSTGGGLLGGLAGILGISGARADGGDVSAGKAYIVGERRPELFVPKSAGTILPAVPQMGGGTNVSAPISITLNAPNATRDGINAMQEQMAQIPLLVRRQLHDLFDRDPRFARSGI